EIIVIAPAEDSEGKDGGRADEMLPRRCQVEGLDLRALIARTQRVSGHGIHKECARRVAIKPEPWRAQMQLCVEGVWILEPGTRVTRVEMNGVRLAQLKVYAIEKVLLVSFGVHYLELRRIEEPSGVQTAGGNEIPPLLAAEGNVKPAVDRSERTVGSAHGSRGRGLPQAGTRGNFDPQAGLVSELCRWRARNDFQRLNGFHGNLVREDLALLVRDGLAVDRERVLRVIPKAMKQPIGIGDYT